MKACPACGRQLNDEARFCDNCGAAQPTIETSVPPPSPTEPAAVAPPLPPEPTHPAEASPPPNADSSPNASATPPRQDLPAAPALPAEGDAVPGERSVPEGQPPVSPELGGPTTKPSWWSRPRNVILVIAAGILVAAAAIAIAMAISKGGGHTINGVLYVGTGGCSLEPGYEDITPGADVTISNASGTVVATTALGQGRAATIGGCEFHFTAKVPDSSFYKIEVSHRGQVTFSKTELQSNGWQAPLELGTSG